MYLLAAALAFAGPQELLAQSRTAEREGRPSLEQSLCIQLVNGYPQAPEAEVCASRLERLALMQEGSSLRRYESLEQARRGVLPPDVVVPLLDSENAELAARAEAWLDRGSHQSDVYRALDGQRRRLSRASWAAVLLLTALSWPLGRATWVKRPRVLGVGIWAGLCVPTLVLVQLYAQLSPRIWALLPAGAAVFLLSAGPAAQLRGVPRVLWGLLSGLGALASTFLVLRWAELLHWVGL
ncbi:MAG: hypothetical protein ACI9VR_000523 [Cognaticolwellia sp.]